MSFSFLFGSNNNANAPSPFRKERGTYVHDIGKFQLPLSYSSSTDSHNGQGTRGLCGLPLFTFCVSFVQISLSLLPFVACPLAPLNLNPMVGPYPTVLDAWGAKNSYKMR